MRGGGIHGLYKMSNFVPTSLIELLVYRISSISPCINYTLTSRVIKLSSCCGVHVN